MKRGAETKAIQDLINILMQEQRCLTAGRIEEATLLLQSKLDALATVEKRIASLGTHDRRSIAREIQAVVEQSKVNEAHLQAVRNGLRRTIHRFEAMADGAKIGAYDAHGASLILSGTVGGYHKKI